MNLWANNDEKLSNNKKINGYLFIKYNTTYPGDSRFNNDVIEGNTIHRNEKGSWNSWGLGPLTLISPRISTSHLMLTKSSRSAEIHIMLLKPERIITYRQIGSVTELLERGNWVTELWDEGNSPT